MHFLTAAQVEQLATVIAPPFGLLVRFDAYTGLRAGELAALRVGRLDLLRGACEVVESATEVANELVWGATNGLPAALRVHDLRHTCASLLIREGRASRPCSTTSGTSRRRSRWTAMGTCSRRSWTTWPTASTACTPRLPCTQRVPTLR
jgi:integrase